MNFLFSAIRLYRIGGSWPFPYLPSNILLNSDLTGWMKKPTCGYRALVMV
jgi:hypothetical protein